MRHRRRSRSTRRASGRNRRTERRSRTRRARTHRRRRAAGKSFAEMFVSEYLMDAAKAMAKEAGADDYDAFPVSGGQGFTVTVSKGDEFRAWLNIDSLAWSGSSGELSYELVLSAPGMHAEVIDSGREGLSMGKFLGTAMGNIVASHL